MPIEFVNVPAWPEKVRVVTSTRGGGHSAAPWDSLNLGDHVHDSTADVAMNRALLARSLPAGSRVQWLCQEHGTRIIQATGVDAPAADASWSDEPGVACAVLTADCLPVLFCGAGGSVVAAAHAGWRGLAAGVLEATLAAMPCVPENVKAWLGPCIGPTAFEVGAEVRTRFIATIGWEAAACFQAVQHSPGQYLADLRQLAKLRLGRAGVLSIQSSSACSYRESGRYFSYRRDGVTGRMVTLVMRSPG